MLRVGLTGGLATGKSHVGRLLASFGCHLISADELGHGVLAPGGAAYGPVVREFGSSILGAGGVIDRRKLAGEVFNRSERLALLNSLVHPAVIALEEAREGEIAAAVPGAIVVVEAAILIETGRYRRYDRLILVVCDEAEQVRRAMRRDGVTEEEVKARLRRQMPLGEKLAYADYVVDTSGPDEETLGQTRRVYESLRSIQQT